MSWPTAEQGDSFVAGGVVWPASVGVIAQRRKGTRPALTRALLILVRGSVFDASAG